ncbi:MAG: MtnX-like HAD-IB family phosphatase [Proteobacteria bacterium]|nr:MtnX-like HAD-IB family phosphatase [Pseudomonadota bacterium]
MRGTDNAASHHPGHPAVSHWTILCDFDGTIALDDTTDTLLERFGRPGWEVLESDWKAGRINSHDCMAGQVGLMDMSCDELDAHLDARAVDPAFAAFVDAAHAQGMHIVIVSDGLDYAIRRILARTGFDSLPIVANHLRQTGERQWSLQFPHADKTCRIGSGTCKCARGRAAHERTLLIGDGASDFCVAETTDFVFAKGKLIEHCRKTSIAHAAIAGFADALPLLPALISGKLVAAPRTAAALPKAALA